MTSRSLFESLELVRLLPQLGFQAFLFTKQVFYHVLELGDLIIALDRFSGRLTVLLLVRRLGDQILKCFFLIKRLRLLGELSSGLLGRVLDAACILLVHRGANDAVRRLVLVHRLLCALTGGYGRNARRVTKPSRLVRGTHTPLQFFPDALFLPHFFLFDSAFFVFLFPRLFLDLLLQSIFHLLGLHFSLVQQNAFLIAASEDTALLFQFHVGAVLSDAAADLEIGEVVFGLHWRVLGLVQGPLILELLLLRHRDHLAVHGLVRVYEWRGAGDFSRRIRVHRLPRFGVLLLVG